MTFPGKIRRLTLAQWMLLCAAMFQLVATRVRLRVSQARELQRATRRAGARSPRHSATVDEVVWAIKAVSRRLPNSRCLADAITASRMLRARGHDPRLVLGVRKDRDAVAAHAWVTCEGRTVIGEVGDLEDYASLRQTPLAAHPISSLSLLLRGTHRSWTALEMTADEFVSACEREDLFCLVHRCLSAERDEGWPEDLRALIGARAREATARELASADETRRVLAQLDAAGVRPILIKGTALAYALYDEPACRSRTDTDLLLRRDDLGAAVDALKGIGYEKPIYCDGELVHRQMELQRRDRFNILHAFDLHWKISSQAAFADVLSYDELDADAQPILPLGPHARGACSVHALLLACIHPVMHHHNAVRILWLYDVRLLAARLTPTEIRAFVELAREKQVAAVCAHQLAHAGEMFGSVGAAWEAAIASLADAGANDPSAEFLQRGRRWHHDLISNLRLSRWDERAQLAREILFPSPRYMRAAYGMGDKRLSGLLLPALYVHRNLAGAWKVLSRKK